MEILRSDGGKYKITDLKPAVRNERRVNVFLDGEFSFSLDVAQVVEFKLKRGMMLSEMELRKLRKASNFGKLYQRTLEWVLMRPRSVRETGDYLRKKKYQRPEYEISDEDIGAVIGRLVSKGYLDDAQFARYYVENRFVKKGVAKKRLMMELREKGVAEDLIVMAFDEVGRNDREEIMKIIAKKRRRYDTDEKLIAYLVRQGFDFELARSSVCEMD
ncbi:RecX family transcriptional regulator [Candidatus Saccharibacteria bacterium]|nr:RecX family transcriptional regulator [Candidatus Saccharibacteria bacterium]